MTDLTDYIRRVHEPQERAMRSEINRLKTLLGLAMSFVPAARVEEFMRRGNELGLRPPSQEPPRVPDERPHVWQVDQ